MDALPPIAVSMGEPAGIGPDLILRLYAEREKHGLSPFAVYGNLGFLAARARRLGLDISFSTSTPEEAAGQFATTLPVIHVDGLVPDKPGDTSPLSGKVVIEAIARAVADTLHHACRGLVTAPIHKAALYMAGFKYPGHTEYLAALCAEGGLVPQSVMMLAHEGLRVVPLTAHVPLREVPDMIRPQLIRDTVKVVERDLRGRFDIPRPHIAIAGLNPHAGEGGAIGEEDKGIINPTILEMQHQGFDVEGPFSADTLFHLPTWKKFDAVIAMYHDQALIPIKTVAFDEAVNITLGLPIVRTSPDHGTAFDLAGSGKGSVRSMLAALRLCDRLTGGVN